MTRNEYDEIEAAAQIAMMGLLAGGGDFAHVDLAMGAFDIAEAFQAEKKKRLGERPGYDD